ncbi:uncharacterized protein (DUF2235 family) [Tardiphaga robiniae]|uniref:DUF2235 domain-containing protein n=1 Tax=Tardiphaga robiniae TaxID=943830 RepID=UPI00285746C5|nr:DUF2235 domain-containing protein [Tardiphaga robiniae]MDR6660778.1 uncharacterized protein (DUF2235 family) [Tardiphaga robiniae]
MKFWHRIWRIMHSIILLAVVALMIAIGVFVGRPGEKGSNQSNLAGADQQQKRLAVFLDGTWNSVDTNTNVWRMRSLCAPTSKDGKPQLIYYSVGVNGFLGGAFGQGLDDNIRLAYEWLIENYREGDEIFIFGFSRGAYTARALAGLIAIDGLLQQGSPIGVSELFDRYKRGDEETIWTLNQMQRDGDTAKMTDQERWLLKYARPVNIKVVGVWDTVGSIGIEAGDFTGISSSQFDYLQTGLRLPVQNGYHALAIDEHRAKFAPTIWDVHRSTAKPRPLSSVEQRWFVGAHANVGGGYETDLLAQPPLRWLMKKAESQGLTFRSDVDLDGDDVTAKIKDSYGEFMYGAYRIISPWPFYRTVGRDPEIRDDGTHRNVNETIDANVFKRWRADPAYRPQNIVEWAQRKHVDPSQFQGSVRADDPSVSVPDP